MAADQEDVIAHLQTAVEHRTTIGIALGMLMERHDLSRGQAFDYLRRMSSTCGTELYDIACGLVETRELPEEPFS